MHSFTQLITVRLGLDPGVRSKDVHVVFRSELHAGHSILGICLACRWSRTILAVWGRAFNQDKFIWTRQWNCEIIIRLSAFMSFILCMEITNKWYWLHHYAELTQMKVAFGTFHYYKIHGNCALYDKFDKKHRKQSELAPWWPVYTTLKMAATRIRKYHISAPVSTIFSCITTLYMLLLWGFHF